MARLPVDVEDPKGTAQIWAARLDEAITLSSPDRGVIEREIRQVAEREPGDVGGVGRGTDRVVEQVDERVVGDRHVVPARIAVRWASVGVVPVTSSELSGVTNTGTSKRAK